MTKTVAALLLIASPAYADTSRDYARDVFHLYGWGRAQFACADKMFTRESHWNHLARNRRGAYGIPQALPGSKMAVEGRDWRTNPRTQLRWAARYIKSRYGSPCRAWKHWKRHGWY